MDSDGLDWAPPHEIEEYRIVRELGRGTMGRVYVAHDRLLDRTVAIKFIAQSVMTDGARRRFFIEARAVARLSHPNVVSIHRVAELRGRPFLVSEYVRGQTLAELDKPVPPSELLAIIVDLARGLAAAHRKGVLHRDIKPANAMRTEEGTTKLLDFGLAELIPADALDDACAAGPAAAGDRPTPEARPAPVHELRDVLSTIDARGPRTPGLTHVGRDGSSWPSHPSVAGTPLYMAPEIWLGQPPTPRADIYSIGILMYELCTGKAPRSGMDSSSCLFAIFNEDLPPLATVAPTVDFRLAAIIDRCVQRDQAARYPNGEALRDAVEGLDDRRRARRVATGGDPYRGLHAFEAEHRDLLFGRDEEATAVMDRMRAGRLVVVAGDSGTGKSSLCRAGVLPLIVNGELEPGIECIHIPVGRKPVLSLAASLCRRLQTDEAAVAHRLRQEPTAVARDLRAAGRRVVLFLDQLEELCTLATPAEAAAMAEALHVLTEPPANIWVLATARSDFLTRLAGLPGLGQDIPGALYLVRPMTPADLRKVILEPAAARGVAFESAEMVQRLVEEAGDADCSLPLLQFVLTELWQARDQERSVIPASVLDRLGGVAGALSRHADDVIAGLPQAERSAARELLLLLVTAEGTRASRTRQELLDLTSLRFPRATEALDALVKGRLLVAQESEEDGGTACSLVHEALLHAWGTLRGWLGRDAEIRALRQRIERAAAEWARVGRAHEALWKERLLLEAASIDDLALPPLDAEFLRASRSAGARRRRRRRATPIGAGLALLGTLFAFHVADVRERDARVQEATSMLQTARRMRAGLEQLREDTFASFDSRGELPRKRAEQLWEQLLVAGPAVERAYAETEEHVDKLLENHRRHPDALRLLGQVLDDRECLTDLGLSLDTDALSRKRRIHGLDTATGARLSVVTSPPGATVSIAVYEQRAGRWRESRPEGLGASPVRERAIAPGSALLLISLAGSSPVRHPILVPRCGTMRVDVRVPSAREIPDGFIYIPAGTFLFASAGGRDGREFFDSQPIHPVETGSYLISRDETTYGQWIEFLRALAPEERATRMPSGGRAGDSFAVRLRELPDSDFELTLGTSERKYVARVGESIHYDGRFRRSSQDWLRMPVSGVSFYDVEAYASWLDRTGRVAGARPCTEHEWERAARGADGRQFPSGGRLEADDANLDMAYGHVLVALGPDEVGSHPLSNSPFGVRDLAGNAWEWTLSVQGPLAAARGGSFYQKPYLARSENRQEGPRDRRDAFYGVRLCASLPPAPVEASARPR